MSASKRGGHRPLRPAITPEGREQQLTALAYDLAERQLVDGTASSQTISHFLKAGSTRDQLEKQRLQNENLYLSAKIKAVADSSRMEELYSSAITAMREYSGHEVQEEEYEEYG
jgi:hypothetical protein